MTKARLLVRHGLGGGAGGLKEGITGGDRRGDRIDLRWDRDRTDRIHV